MAAWTCEACGGENLEGMRFCGHCGAAAAEAASEPQPDDEHDVADALRSFIAGPVAERLVEAGGRLPEERRLVTALFADVSGFTALADRLDPEELLEVIDPVIAALSTVVGRYGGYVEKFAGDALMALFGAPVSHGDDASRALRVALEMHRELARLIEDLPHDADLTLHVGVNSGHGIARILGSEARMDYAVLGDSVILAQRLESAAPPGETYVSDTTVRLTEADFDFEPVGELTLKGKAEPVPTFRLLGERAKGVEIASAALIGRQAELAVVEDVLGGLFAGSGGMLAVTGEPGIGKSRLTEAALQRATERGARLVTARCLSYGAGLAYWPYVDLIRRSAALRSDEQPNETRTRLDALLEDAGLPQAAPYFARLLGLPVEDEEISGLEPEAFRRGLHDTFRAWISAQAAGAPVVLVVEDVHWADASTLDLTAEVAQLALTVPLLLLLVARPEGREQIATVAGGLSQRSIDLAPLDRAAVAQLAQGILGGPAPEALLAFVEERTSGNPFFVQELVRALRDRQVLIAGDDGWTIRPGWDERQLPVTIEGVLSARIDLLPRDAAALLQTASVVGRRMRVDLLEAVSDLGAPAKMLDELVRSGFLDRAQEDGEQVVVFHHALVQDAAYSRLLRRRRRALHRRVADGAEALYGSGDHVIDLLARHHYLGESPQARDYLIRAGDRAKRLYANEEAILHFRRAVELAPDDDEVWLSLADLAELVGGYDEALEIYQAVRDRTSDVRAWRGLASTYRKRGEYIAALATIDAAFAAAPLKESDLTPLWLEAGWALYLTSRLDQAIDVLQAGIEVAEEPAQPIVGHLLVHLARAEVLADRLPDAIDHAIKAQALLEQQQDLRGLTSALRVAGDAYRAKGLPDDAVEALRRGLELAERTGSVEEIGACLINLGLAELERGAHPEAISLNRRAIEEFERIGHGSGSTIGYSNLAWALTQAGRYSEALEACERARALARSIGHPLTVAETTDTMAIADFRQGNYAEAATRSEEAAVLFTELGAARRAAESFELAAQAWELAQDAERARAALDRARSLLTTP